MKTIFKKAATLSTIIILLICFLTFSACLATNTDLKRITITIGENEYALETNGEYLHNALLELEEQEIIDKYYFTKGAYGVFIEALSTLDLSAENSFVAIFHNIDDVALIDYSNYASAPIVIDGATYNPSGYGVAELPLYDGAKYLLKVSTY